METISYDCHAYESVDNIGAHLGLHLKNGWKIIQDFKS